MIDDPSHVTVLLSPTMVAIFKIQRNCTILFYDTSDAHIYSDINHYRKTLAIYFLGKIHFIRDFILYFRSSLDYPICIHNTRVTIIYALYFFSDTTFIRDDPFSTLSRYSLSFAALMLDTGQLRYIILLIHFEIRVYTIAISVQLVDA